MPPSALPFLRVAVCKGCGQTFDHHPSVQALCERVTELEGLVARARARYRARGSAAEMYAILEEGVSQ